MSNKRADDAYRIDALANALRVLECLGEPTRIDRIVERTGLTYDYCRRALITFKLSGFAEQNTKGEWTAGKKLAELQLAAMF